MKIGITLDMSVAFWANGMQQNIVFLHDILKRVGNHCYYITYKKPAYILDKKHQGMMLEDLIRDEFEVLDVIIIAGFDLLPEMYDRLKARNQKLKIIIMHFGNKMMDDIHYAISTHQTQKKPLRKPRHLDQVWVSPQHEYSIPYLKTYYKTEKVVSVPYIWDPFFVQEKIKELKEKGLSPFFQEDKLKKVCIFEPNISHVKNCIVPLMICERVKQEYPKSITQVSCFSTEKLRQKKYFDSLISELKISQEEKNFYLANKWSSLDAISKFGNTIVSHQYDNELNYSYFETLYLGLPLIHNSDALMDAGYYYPKFDIEMGAKQLHSAILNHSNVAADYMEYSRDLIKKYSPYTEENTYKYKELVRGTK